MVPTKRLGEKLLEARLITKSQLQGALNRQASRGGLLGSNLIQLGAIKELELLRFLARSTGIPEVDAARTEIPQEVVQAFPKKIAERFNMMPLYRKDRHRLVVACTDPTDVASLDEVAFTTGFRIEPVLSSYSSIQTAINRHYRGLDMETREAREEDSVTASEEGEPIEGNVERKRLGEMLLDAGLITQLQLKHALAMQKARGGLLGDLLVRTRALDERQLVRFLARTTGVGTLNIEGLSVPDEVVTRIPRNVARRFGVAAVGMERRGVLKVACADPTQADVLDHLEFITGCRIQPVLASHSAISRFIATHYDADHPIHVLSPEEAGVTDDDIIRPGEENPTPDTGHYSGRWDAGFEFDR